MNSRRQFIMRCSSALLGTAALPVFGSLGPARNVRLDFASFSKHLESAFGLVKGSGKILPVILAKVEVYRPSHRPELATEDNFNLHFTSRSKEVMEQGIYPFHHPSLGEIGLFVVPHRNATTGFTEYIATFHATAIAA